MATKDIKFSYVDAPTIEAFALSNARFRGLMGPFGSGKSSGCVIEILKRGLAQVPGSDGVRRTRWAVIRNTYPQLKDTTIRTFFDWFPPTHFGEYFKAEHNYIMKPCKDVEIEIMFRALDRPEHISNLLSLELTGAWINEAREVPWTIIDALDGRIKRYPPVREGGVTWGGIFMDTNPPDDDSKWFHFFEELRPDNAEVFKQPSGRSDRAENLSNLPEGYYTEMLKGKDPEWVKVYVDGMYGFVQDGKPVFPEYNDSVHCAREELQPLVGVPIRRGWDFGLTPACVFSQMTPKGQWIVFDEMVAERAGIDQFSDKVIPYCANTFPGFAFIDDGDPAGMQAAQTDEKTCFDILNAKGIGIQPGEQTLAIRLESVRKSLSTMIDGEPGFLLSPRCRTLRKGLLGRYRYRRMKVSADRYDDRPEKNMYSHPMDGLQYTATNLYRSALTTPTWKSKPITYPQMGIV